jgi:hypothetical protein
MPYTYHDADRLHVDDFDGFGAWHHEGVGAIESAEGGGMRLHCFGSHQGGRGSMAFADRGTHAKRNLEDPRE